MAFNPFHWFRKERNKKILFVCLIIMCMLVFILSFGAGDAVQRGLAFFGGVRGQGEVVVKLYGDKVYERDLRQLLEHRRAASAFLLRTAGEHQYAAVQDLEKDKELASGLSSLGGMAKSYPVRAKMLVFSQRNPPSIERIVGEVQDDLNHLARLATNADVRDDPANLQKLQNMATALGFLLWQAEVFLQLPGRGEVFYFGGSRRPDDLLDFLIWRHYADKLGITLTDEGVLQELNREACGREAIPGKSFANDPKVKQFLSNKELSGITPAILLEALRDEFRVCMAQSLVLGREPGARAYRNLLGANASPAVGTLDEFLKYYRKQRTTLTVRFLPLAVENFVNSLKAREPSEAELRTLFEQNKNHEADPSRREPGFKEPERVAIEWVSARPDDPYYKELSGALLGAYSDPKEVVKFRFGGLAGAPLPGTGALGPLAARAAPLALDPLALADAAYRRDNSYWSHPEDKTIVDLDDGKVLPHRSAYRPDNVGQTLGALLGASLSGNAFAAPATWYGLGTAHKVQDGAGFATLLLGRGLPPLPGAPVLGWPIGLAGRYRSQALAPAAVRPLLLVQEQERMATTLLENDLRGLEAELAKFKGKEKEKEKVRAYVLKAVEDFHLRHGSMPSLHSAQEIAEGLKGAQDKFNLRPLLEAARRTWGGRSLTVRQFADMLLDKDRPQGAPPAAPYQVRRITSAASSGEATLFWRTADMPARVPVSLSAVRRQVEAAWRFERARQLARKKALELAKEKAQTAGDIKPFELQDIALLVPKGPQALAGPPVPFRPYRVPPDQAEQFPYPPADLAAQLMQLKQPGDAMVIADRPARTFYVATLVARDDRQNLDDFFSTVYGKGASQGALWQHFLADRSQEYRKKVLEQLRREAVGADKIDKDGKYVLAEDVRKRLEGRGEAPE
jgi:hypothetical protein